MKPHPKVVYLSSLSFREFVSTYPCSVPGCELGSYHEEIGGNLTDPHHLLAKGMGGKGMKHDEIGNTVALCRLHHTGCLGTCIHALGLHAFQDKHEVALWPIAKLIGSDWRIKLARERNE